MTTSTTSQLQSLLERVEAREETARRLMREAKTVWLEGAATGQAAAYSFIASQLRAMIAKSQTDSAASDAEGR